MLSLSTSSIRRPGKQARLRRRENARRLLKAIRLAKRKSRGKPPRSRFLNLLNAMAKTQRSKLVDDLTSSNDPALEHVPHSDDFTQIATILSHYMNKQLDVTIEMSTYVQFASAIMSFVVSAIMAYRMNSTSALDTGLRFTAVVSGFVNAVSSLVNFICTVLRRKRIRDAKTVINTFKSNVANVLSDTTKDDWIAKFKDTLNGILSRGEIVSARRVASLVVETTPNPPIPPVIPTVHLPPPPPVATIVDTSVPPPTTAWSPITTVTTTTASLPTAPTTTPSDFKIDWTLCIDKPNKFPLSDEKKIVIQNATDDSLTIGGETFALAPQLIPKSGQNTCLPDILARWLGAPDPQFFYQKYNLKQKAFQQTSLVYNVTCDVPFNYILVDSKNVPIEMKQTTSQLRTHNTLILRQANAHFVNLSSDYFNRCTSDCCGVSTPYSTLVCPPKGYQIGTMRGGAEQSFAQGAIQGILGVVLAAGISGAKISGIDIKPMRDILSTFNVASTFSGNTAKFGDFMLKNLFDAQDEDAEKDRRLLLQLTDYAGRLLAVQPSEICATPQLVHHFVDFPSMVQRVTSSVTINQDILPMIANIRLLSTTIANKTPAMVSALSSMCDRPPTKFFQLYGKKGVGKSHCIAQLGKDVLAELGLPQDLFNARVNEDGYFNTYAGQRGGYVEEFLLKSHKDEFLQKINVMGSNTSMSMPAAFEKYQYCQLLFVLLTANTRKVNLSGTFITEGADAIWSRIAQINMELADSNIVIHDGNRYDTSFRKDDWSHVNFFLHVKKPDENGVITDQVDKYTYSGLKDLIVERIRQDANFRNDVEPKTVTEALSAHKRFISTLNQSKPVEHTPHHVPAAGTSHLFVMMSGPAGTYKTTRVLNEILPGLQLAFPCSPQVIINSTFKLDQYLQHPPSNPVILFIDDLIVAQQDKVAEAINNTPAPSIVIHTANLNESKIAHLGNYIEYKKKKITNFFLKKQDVALDKHTLKADRDTISTALSTEGIIRRSGITGHVKCGNSYFKANPARSLWFQSTLEDGNVVHLRRAHTHDIITPVFVTCQIAKKYKAIINNEGPFQYATYDSIPDIDWDVELNLKDITRLQAFLNNPAKFAAITEFQRSPNPPPEHIYIGPSVLAAYNGIVPAGLGEDVSDLRPIVTHFISSLWQSCPGASVRINLGTFKLYAHEGKVYLPSESGFSVRQNGEQLHISFLGTSFVSDVDYVKKVLRDGVGDSSDPLDIFLLDNAQEFFRNDTVSAILMQDKIHRQDRQEHVRRAVSSKKWIDRIRKHSWVQILLGVICAVAAVVVLFKLGKYVYNVVKNRTKDDDKEDKKTPTPTTPQATVTELPPLVRTVVEQARVSEASESRAMLSNNWRNDAHHLGSWQQHAGANVFDQIRKIRRQIVHISSEKGACYATMLTGNVGICPSHVAGPQMTVNNSACTTTVKSYSCNYTKDMAIFQTTKDVHGCGSILGKIKPYNQMGSIDHVRVITKTADHSITTTYTAEQLASRGGKTYMLADYLRGSNVEPNLGEGDCGLPALHIDFSRSVVSLAGIYLGLLAKLPFVGCMHSEVPLPHKAQSTNVFNFGSEASSFSVLGEEAELFKSLLPNNRFTFHKDIEVLGSTPFTGVPIRKRHMPTPYLGLFNLGVTKVPAEVYNTTAPGPYHKFTTLVKRDGQQSIEYAQLPTLVSKQAPLPVVIDQELLSDCVKLLSIKYQGVYGTEGKELTAGQVLNGFRGQHKLRRCLAPLNLDAGAGFIQVLKKAPLKKHIFYKDTDHFVQWQDNPTAQRTLERFNLADTELQEGRLVNFVAIDSLKTELLPREKAIAGKIRLYQASSTEEVLLVRKYFGNFMARAVKHHRRTHNQTGFNPWTDFNAIAHRLLKISPTGEDGDYSNYDKSIPYDFMRSATLVINSCYDDDNGDCRLGLTYLLSHGIHVVEGILYRTSNGNPSGHAATSLINGVVNDLLQYYCYYKTRKTHPTLPDIDLALDWVCSGDDSVTFVKEQYQTMYNPEAKSAILKEIGMTYTSSAKDGSALGFKPLTELSFCSHAFVAHGPYYLGALKDETMISFIQWTTSREPGQLAANLTNFCFEMSCHKEADFNRYFDYLSAIVRSDKQYLQYFPFCIDRDFVRGLGLRILISELNSHSSNDHNDSLSLDPLSQTIAKLNINSYVVTDKDLALSVYLDDVTRSFPAEMDFVSLLNQMCQKRCLTVSWSEKPTDKTWTLTVACGSLSASASAATKKVAKQEAARKAINILDGQAPLCPTYIIHHLATCKGSATFTSLGAHIKCSLSANCETVATASALTAEEALQSAYKAWLIAPQTALPHVRHMDRPAVAPTSDTLTAENAAAVTVPIPGGVPFAGIIRGGIEQDFKAKALSIWGELARLTTDSSLNYGQALWSAAYGSPYDLLTGFSKVWADTHKFGAGGVDVTIQIQGQPYAKGTVILAMVNALLPQYTAADLTELGYMHEFPTSGFTETGVNIPFMSRTQTYWIPGEAATEHDHLPRYLVLVCGNRPVGLAMDSETVTTVDIIIRTRPSSDFVCSVARLPQAAKDDSSSPNWTDSLVGKTIGEIFGGPRLYVCTDGTNPDTKAWKVTEPSVYEEGLPSIANHPVDGTGLRTALTRNYHHYRIAGVDHPTLLGSVMPGSGFIPSSSTVACFLQVATPYPHNMDGANIRAQTLGMTSVPTSFLPWTDDGDQEPDNSDQYYQGKYRWIIGQRPPCDQFGVISMEPATSGTADLKLTFQDDVETWPVDIDTYTFDDGSSGVVCTSGKIPGFTAVGNETTPACTFVKDQYDNPDAYRSVIPCLPSLNTAPLEGIDKVLSVIELSNVAITYSAAYDNKYPNTGFRRLALTSQVPPATTITNGRPTLHLPKSTHKALTDMRDNIKEGTSLAITLADPRFNTSVITVVIPQDSTLAPYGVFTKTEPDYGYIGSDMNAYYISKAHTYNAGVPIATVAAHAFINRYHSPAALEHEPHMMATAGLMAGRSALDFGSSAGSSALLNLFHSRSREDWQQFMSGDREDRQEFMKLMQQNGLTNDIARMQATANTIGAYKASQWDKYGPGTQFQNNPNPNESTTKPDPSSTRSSDFTTDQQGRLVSGVLKGGGEGDDDPMKWARQHAPTEELKKDGEKPIPLISYHDPKNPTANATRVGFSLNNQGDLGETRPVAKNVKGAGLGFNNPTKDSQMRTHTQFAMADWESKMGERLPMGEREAAFANYSRMATGKAPTQWVSESAALGTPESYQKQWISERDALSTPGHQTANWPSDVRAAAQTLEPQRSFVAPEERRTMKATRTHQDEPMEVDTQSVDEPMEVDPYVEPAEPMEVDPYVEPTNSSTIRPGGHEWKEAQDVHDTAQADARPYVAPNERTIMKPRTTGVPRVS